MTRGEWAPGRFTIVLPVRNGDGYVRECVASVLAQSFGDFGLAILENASTDGTAEWLETLSDPRIRVWPAPRPLSIEENWSRALALPKGEFMLFVGHDDRLDPSYLGVIDALIRREPDAALFTTHFRLIGADGRVIRRCRPMPARESEVIGDGILVNAIVPGETRTALNPSGTQEPEAVYPYLKELATLPPDGPSGKAFRNGREYRVLQPSDDLMSRLLRRMRGARRG